MKYRSLAHYRCISYAILGAAVFLVGSAAFGQDAVVAHVAPPADVPPWMWELIRDQGFGAVALAVIGYKLGTKLPDGIPVTIRVDAESLKNLGGTPITLKLDEASAKIPLKIVLDAEASQKLQVSREG